MLIDNMSILERRSLSASGAGSTHIGRGVALAPNPNAQDQRPRIGAEMSYMVLDLQKGSSARRVRRTASQDAASPHPGSAAPEENKLGQQRGAKGTRTRRAIMDATLELLRSRPFGDVKITDIARAANIAQPNFYTYFSSIDEVVLAIAQEVTADDLATFAESSWEGAEGLDRVRKLVEAALPFWQRYSPVLQVVFILADRGAPQFAELQVNLMRRIYKGIENHVRDAQKAGRVSPSVNGRLVGYECVSLLASISTRYRLFRDSGFTHEQLVETTARVLYAAVMGGPPEEISSRE